VRPAAAWDDRCLYLGCHVADNTPWVNGATDPAMLYLGGDTVDFQMGTDPNAPRQRSEAATPQATPGPRKTRFPRAPRAVVARGSGDYHRLLWIPWFPP